MSPEIDAAGSLPPFDSKAETADLPAGPPPPTLPPSGGSGDSHGDEVGPYRLISVLGEGGFGVVWLAERRLPFVQRVALKLIKPGMDSATVLARFEMERQVLAAIDHPHVAKVLDGGMAASGRPYFAMEYVEGLPISDHCDRSRMPIRDRLRLFVQVCEAVQHAHMRGVIHRDLKPSNVLVSIDATGQPHVKVIDFGIAKALTQRDAERKFFTEAGQLIGTPEYVSPEQAELGSEDIDTRTDVYSLGVMLYELLVGALPFEPRELRSRAFREMQRVIREVDPPTPSARLSTIASKDSMRASRISETRRERLDVLASELRRELEWIPLKAMRKERDQRYGSASDLSDDIRRFLDGRPLKAAPESRVYRARKFVRRHRGAVAAAVAVGSALSAGFIATAWQWRVAVGALAEAEAMNAFVVDDVFGASDVDRYDEGVRAVDLVREAALLAPQRFPSDPRLRGRVLLAMGRALLGVGSPKEAIAPLEFARADRASLEPGDRAQLDISLAEALYRTTGGKDPVRGAMLAREALAAARGMDPVDLALESTALNHLGGAMKGQGDLDGAAQAYKDALAIREATFGVASVEAHVVRGNLGLVRLERARTLGRDARAAREEAAAATDPVAREAALARSREMASAAADGLEAAALEFGRLADAAKRDLGERHGHTISMANEHATALLLRSLLLRASDPAKADELAVRAVDAFVPLEAIVAERLSPTHFRRVWIAGNHARALADLGRVAEAASVLRQLFDPAEMLRAPMTADQAALAGELMRHLDGLGRIDEAIGHAEASLRWARRSADPRARVRAIEAAVSANIEARTSAADPEGLRRWTEFGAKLSPSKP